MRIIKKTGKIIRLVYSDLKKKVFWRTRLPRELQFPITYHCNFDCVMCGMNGIKERKHISAGDISAILKDELFSKITSVGINGGEPFIRKDLTECIESVVTALPNLQQINIISNGFLTDKILSDLIEIKKICSNRKIKLNISFSIDGIGAMQDFMRNRKGAFENVINTVHSIQKDQEKYCDFLNVICTITKHNIFEIGKVENWVKNNGINVSYNIATINKRISNDDKYSYFSILEDKEAEMLAREFFYKKYRETKDERYFALYLYLRKRKRYANCQYQYYNGVVLSPDGELSYCATWSDTIGSSLDTSAIKVFRNNRKYCKKIKREKCNSCSHYIYSLNFSGRIMLFFENLKFWYLNKLTREW